MSAQPLDRRPGAARSRRPAGRAFPPGGPEAPANDSTALVVGFARTLRAAGVAATTDRVQQAVRALDVLDPAARDDVYWACRLTFCGDPDDVERYDRAFAAFFSGGLPRTGFAPARREPVRRLAVADAPDQDDTGDGDPRPPLGAAASAADVLRDRDIAALTDAEREHLARLLSAFALPGEARRTRRYRAAHRGRVDPGATVRELLRQGGEPARLRHRTFRERPRRVVLLVDVSGSMSAYGDALLRFAHAASRRSAVRTEIFTIGTRLTRVSREMGHRDPDWAMAAVASAVPDWSGGTRLGELLKAFLDRWGQRGMARGAVVVVLSDGWERGDARLLGEQMARLGRLAHRVVWANPRKGHRGYAPLAAGMAAALPHVDDFVEGHSLGALERLAGVVAGAARARRGGTSLATGRGNSDA